MTYQSLNPFNGELVESFDPLGDSPLESKIAGAQACFEMWRHKGYAERAEIIARAGEILHERADAFARIMTLEMGKRIAEARGEVEFSARIMAYYAKNAERFLAPQKLKPKSGQAVIESSPLGVLVDVQPWNFPDYQLARFAAPNLMAGNEKN